jgi:hypothetical protein
MHLTTGVSMEYRHLISDPTTKAAWQLSTANEFRHLAQGIGDRIKGTNTMKFIQANELPADQQPTYIWTEQPQKEEKFHTQMTVGGNLIDYPGNVSTAEMDTIKILLNRVDHPGRTICSANMTNFYLNMPMDRHEFVCIPINLIPDEILHEYQLHNLVDSKGFVLACIEKGMYGLLQAGMLVNKLLQEQLGPHGYHACKHTAGLWQHDNQPIMLTLIVDDFGIHYKGKQQAHHLIAALKQDYEAVTTDWDGMLFCGITINWDYQARCQSVNAQLHSQGPARVPTYRTHHSRTSLHRNNEPQYRV